MITTLLAITLLPLLLTVSTGTSESPAPDSTDRPDSLMSEETILSVTIERVTSGDMHLDDTLIVWLESGGVSIAGFDLKVGIDGDLIDVIDILPGEILDSCGWEYFRARPVNTFGRDDYPLVLWQAVGLAEVLPDSLRPLCFGFDREASLLRIVLANAPVGNTPDTSIPVFFYWEDCTDNTLAGITGNTLLMSRRVIDYFHAGSEPSAALFPNRTGAPIKCIHGSANNPPRRQIDFHNGGVVFRLDVDAVRPDSTWPDSAR